MSLVSRNLLLPQQFLQLEWKWLAKFLTWYNFNTRKSGYLCEDVVLLGYHLWKYNCQKNPFNQIFKPALEAIYMYEAVKDKCSGIQSQSSYIGTH